MSRRIAKAPKAQKLAEMEHEVEPQPVECYWCAEMVASVDDNGYCETCRSEPSYCHHCEAVLIDEHSNTLLEWCCTEGDRYCRGCYEAGKIIDSWTRRKVVWGKHALHQGAPLSTDLEQRYVN